jgi:hypothetical protein
MMLADGGGVPPVTRSQSVRQWQRRGTEAVGTAEPRRSY